VRDPDPSSRADPNDIFLKPVLDRAKRLIDEGMNRDEALTKVYEAGMAAAEKTAVESAVTHESDALVYVAEMREFRGGFEDRLREHWGPALDLYEGIVEITFGASRSFQDRHAEEQGDLGVLLDVLHRLNGQCLRTAREVHALLSGGYPLGALALARTVHEIAVRASILSTFGSQSGHTDLAERFAQHDHVTNYKDAVVFQRDAEALGYEPLDEIEMVQLKRASDEAIARYGKHFASPYGWASGLPGLTSPAPNFRDLEALAGLSHHRGLYNLSSHVVHADSKAMRMSMFERGGRSVILTASTNVALADPAQHTLMGVQRTFISLITSVPVSLYDLHISHVLRILVDKAHLMLVDAEEAIDDAEQSLQAELAEQGLRFDPIDGEVALDPPAREDT
jgi:hypothetical protein